MKETQNAKDIKEVAGYKILAVGQPGTGKSTQYSTLPGRKFLYIFDPNSKESLQGDIEYIEFIPDITDLNIAAKTLRSPDKQKTVDKPSIKETEPKTFLEFEADFSERWQKKYFDDFDWVGFDGLTTLSEIMLDRITYLAKRPGKAPEQADYTAEMALMKGVIRVLSSLPNIYCTAHLEIQKDELIGKIYWQLLVVGKNRTRVPLRFTDVLGFDNDGPKYVIKTEREKDNPVIRVTQRIKRGRSNPIDVTINPNKPIIGQGLGGLLKWRT